MVLKPNIFSVLTSPSQAIRGCFDVASHDQDITALSEVAIAPGATLDLHRHEWCLFLSNILKKPGGRRGAYPARLMFRHAGTIDIEFLVDAPHH